MPENTNKPGQGGFLGLPADLEDVIEAPAPEPTEEPK